MPYRPGVPISAGLLSKYCANQTDKFKSFPISLNSAVFPIFHFNQLPRVQRGCHVSYHFRVTSEMAGRQVTAIISQSGEPIRNIPWPLYYKPCQYNYPQWGESSQRGGSCDTTPATPESLLTDSVDTPTEFYPKFGQNKLGGRHSRASPELLSFCVSELLHQDKPGHATPDYEPAVSPPGYVFGNNRVCSTPGYVFGTSSWRPPDNRTPYHAGRDKGEISLFENLPLSVKTKENPILTSKDKLFFRNM